MTTVTTQRVPAPLVMSLGDGDRGMVDLLGGKGANLAEMTRLGLPVPHGFVITTEAAALPAHGQEPAELSHWSPIACVSWRPRPAEGSDTRMIRYWSPCGRVQGSRCRA